MPVYQTQQLRHTMLVSWFIYLVLLPNYFLYYHITYALVVWLYMAFVQDFVSAVVAGDWGLFS